MEYFHTKSPPPPGVYIAPPNPLPVARSLPPPTQALCHPARPVSLACHSRDHAGRPRVVAVHRCPSLSPSPFPTSPQGLLSLPSGNGSSKHILFFWLAILLRVSGQFPQAENNYPLSIIGTLWELYLRKKSQFHSPPPPSLYPTTPLDRSKSIFLVLIFFLVPYVGLSDCSPWS